MNATLASQPVAIDHSRDWAGLFVERLEVLLTMDDGDVGARERLEKIDAQLGLREEGAFRTRLIRRLGLSPLETSWIDSALALHIQPSLAIAVGKRLVGDGYGVLSEQAVCRINDVPFEPLLRPGSPLLAWRLLVPGAVHASLGQDMRIDPSIAAALLGRIGMDRELAPFLWSPSVLSHQPVEWPVDQLTQKITRLLRLERPVHFAIRGPVGSGRTGFAAQLAERLGTRLHRVLPEIPEDLGTQMLLERLCLLSGQAPLFSGGTAACSCGASLPLVMQLLQPGELPTPHGEKAVLDFDLPPLSSQSKGELWSAMSRSQASGPVSIKATPPADLDAARYCDIARTVRAMPESIDEAKDLLRQGRRSRLAAIGNLLDLPYGWDDIVLNARQHGQLELLVREMRLRDAMLDQAGRRAKYGGLGQSALFWGAPGTGKTMAAQVIARELGCDLLRVDLASVVSKFIGETAKNLRHIFTEVQNTGALLVFDEADSLFARRTDVKDAHDRFANADTNYLLQLIETHDTAAILLTNKKENIDPAFMRRMRHIVDFPLAAAPERKTLWTRHLKALSDQPLPAQAGEKLAVALALVELSPAQIKGAALSAAFARLAKEAEQIAVPDLLTGIERELAKDGQSFDRNLKREIAAHG